MNIDELLADNDFRVNEQQLLSGRILHRLEVIDPYCILAGGAVRNWYFGKPAKDLDFYVYFPKTHSQVSFKRSLRRLFGFNVRVKYNHEEAENKYSGMKTLRSVYDILGFDTDVQVMRMDEPTFGLVETFPVNMSKAWYKNGQSVFDYDFKLGAKSKFLIMDETYQNKNYLNKIRSYFPDYTVGTREQAEKKILTEAVLN